MLVSILGGLLGDLIFLPALLKTAPWLLDSNYVSTPDAETTTVFALETDAEPAERIAA